jgi:hypothetical protein
MFFLTVYAFTCNSHILLLQWIIIITLPLGFSLGDIHVISTPFIMPVIARSQAKGLTRPNDGTSTSLSSQTGSTDELPKISLTNTTSACFPTTSINNISITNYNFTNVEHNFNPSSSSSPTFTSLDFRNSTDAGCSLKISNSTSFEIWNVFPLCLVLLIILPFHNYQPWRKIVRTC